MLLCCYFSLYHCIWLYENKDIYNDIQLELKITHLAFINNQTSQREAIDLYRGWVLITLEYIYINQTTIRSREGRLCLYTIRNTYNTNNYKTTHEARVIKDLSFSTPTT
jgi:hypothetical protein